MPISATSLHLQRLRLSRLGHFLTTALTPCPSNFLPLGLAATNWLLHGLDSPGNLQPGYGIKLCPDFQLQCLCLDLPFLRLAVVQWVYRWWLCSPSFSIKKVPSCQRMKTDIRLMVWEMLAFWDMPDLWSILIEQVLKPYIWFGIYWNRTWLNEIQ